MQALKTTDWVVVPATIDQEAAARKIREGRDRIYGNIYKESNTDVRWVGDLGEILLNDWLAAQGLMGFEWIKNNSAGKPDFITKEGIRIGAKTVKRQGAPKLGYTAQITAKHATEPADYFFFMSYDIINRQMYLLGAIQAARFLHEATYYGPGAQVHANYQIRPGHEIYNIELTKLEPAFNWVRSLTKPLAGEAEPLSAISWQFEPPEHSSRRLRAAAGNGVHC